MRSFLPALALALLLALAATQAVAQEGFSNPASPANSTASGGFVGPGPGLDTVDQALKLRDDAPVALRGNIVRHLGGEKYLFQDDTGSIAVDIDQRKWAGQNVTPQDRIEIHGEIDKDWNSIEVDVDTIRKI